MRNVREIFSDPVYSEFFRSGNDVDTAALATIADLVMLAATTTSPSEKQDLENLQHEVLRLLVEFRLKKVSSEDLYKKANILIRALEPALKKRVEKKAKSDQSPVTEQELVLLSKIERYSAQAHEDALSAQAPAAVIRSIRKSKNFSDQWVPEARTEASSFFKVDVFHNKNELKVTATLERADKQVLQRLRDNPDTNTIILNGVPGSGKSTFMAALEVLLRNEGWEVVVIEFDEVIAAFAAREKKETKKWDALTAEEFDDSFFDLAKNVASYYPQDYQDKRKIILIPNLGYKYYRLLLGLRLIGNHLKDILNKGNALVLNVVAEPAVIEVAKNKRAEGVFGVKGTGNAAEFLKKSGGAPKSAVINHGVELDKQITKILSDPGFDKLVKNTDMSALNEYVSAQDLQQMVLRLSYAIITRNEHEIKAENWWFIINLFKAEGKEFPIRPVQ